MGNLITRRIAIMLSLTAAIFCNVTLAADGGNPIAKAQNSELSVIVLGSGGPMPTAEGRASAGYMILTDGQPRLLMDLGGGTYQRIAATEARTQNIEAILLSHLHIDHMADLSAAIKGIYFHARQDDEPRGADRPIKIYGPDLNAAGQFPSTEEYATTLYEDSIGLERYLHTFAKAISGGVFAYTVTNLSPNPNGVIEQIIPEEPVDDQYQGLVVRAVGVYHGPVPAVAFRVDYKGHSIVYTGDTNSRMPPPKTPTCNPFIPLCTPLSQNLITLATGADLMIYDTAITDSEPSKVAPNPAIGFLGDRLFFNLHTTPTTMGQVVSQAGVKTLVLSHITPITEGSLAEVKSVVRTQGYTGKISVAKDLKVYNLGNNGVVEEVE